jgi:hypothetical protein
MNTVWVPQQPSRYDQVEGVWVPTVNLRPAAVYGQIEVLLPPGMSPIALVPIKQALKEKLANSQPDDLLLAVGDPSIIALCAVILAMKHGKLIMLKWDKNNGDYFKVEVEI